MNKQISIFACSFIPTIICLYFSNHSSKNSLGTLIPRLPIFYQFFADYISPVLFHFFEFICAICLLSTKCVAYFHSTSGLPLLLNRSSFPFSPQPILTNGGVQSIFLCIFIDLLQNFGPLIEITRTCFLQIRYFVKLPSFIILFSQYTNFH